MPQNFQQEVKIWLRNGGMTNRLLFINAVIFLSIAVIGVFAGLISPITASRIDAFFTVVFGLRTDLSGFLTHPWGLITSMFAHFTFWHILMNLLFLFFAGRAFEQFFDGKRLVHTYVWGGLIGGLFEIGAHAVFPALQNQSTVVVGASASVMAIFSALAFHRPQLQVNLFGVFPLKIIYLAIFFLVLDFFNLGKPDGVAHFAHLGGFLLGWISIQNIYSKSNIITFSMNLTKGWFQKKSSFSAGNTRSTQFKTDEQYNQESKEKQAEIDRVLDKIAKAGYDSLTKREKEFLFKQSKH